MLTFQQQQVFKKKLPTVISKVRTSLDKEISNRIKAPSSFTSTTTEIKSRLLTLPEDLNFISSEYNDALQRFRDTIDEKLKEEHFHAQREHLKRRFESVLFSGIQKEYQQFIKRQEKANTKDLQTENTLNTSFLLDCCTDRVFTIACVVALIAGIALIMAGLTGGALTPVLAIPAVVFVLSSASIPADFMFIVGVVATLMSGCFLATSFFSREPEEQFEIIPEMEEESLFSSSPSS